MENLLKAMQEAVKDYDRLQDALEQANATINRLEAQLALYVERYGTYDDILAEAAAPTETPCELWEDAQELEECQLEELTDEQKMYYYQKHF